MFIFSTPKSKPSLVDYVPTDEDVNNVCLSYRHDFGLMSEEEQKSLRFEAKEWLHAWKKTIK